MVFWFTFGAALLSLVWFFVHLFMGGRQIAVPLCASDIDPVVRNTAYLCWHITSWTLLAMAIMFAMALWTGNGAYTLSGTMLSAGVMLVGLALPPLNAIPYGRVPQGWLFVPNTLLGGLALWL